MDEEASLSNQSSECVPSRIFYLFFLLVSGVCVIECEFIFSRKQRFLWGWKEVVFGTLSEHLSLIYKIKSDFTYN